MHRAACLAVLAFLFACEGGNTSGAGVTDGGSPHPSLADGGAFLHLSDECLLCHPVEQRDTSGKRDINGRGNDVLPFPSRASPGGAANEELKRFYRDLYSRKSPHPPSYPCGSCHVPLRRWKIGPECGACHASSLLPRDPESVDHGDRLRAGAGPIIDDPPAMTGTTAQSWVELYMRLAKRRQPHGWAYPCATCHALR